MVEMGRLPAPLTEIWEWQAHGACREMDSSNFFHHERERGPSRAAREQKAKQVCRRCPVLEECLRHALTVEEPYGVWGGQTEAERRVVIQERRRAGRSAHPQGVRGRHGSRLRRPADVVEASGSG